MEKNNLLIDDLEEEKILSLYNLYKDKNYITVYKNFLCSNGLKKIALGRVLAKKISDGCFFMDANCIEEFLSALDIDALWMIASCSKNEELKALASKKVMAFLDDNIKFKKKVYRKKR